MYVCTYHAWYPMVSYHLELDLQMIANHHMGAGN